MGQALRRLKLPFGVDDFRTPVPFGLGLLRDGPLHLLREVDVLDLNGRDLDPPGLRLCIDNALKLGIDLVALGEQVIEQALTEHAPKGGLCNHGGRVEVILDGHDRLLRLIDTEVNHRIDLDGDVVLGDDILGWHVHRDRSEAHPLEVVDEGNDDDDARTVPTEDAPREASESKDHGSLVFGEHLEPHDDQEGEQDKKYEQVGHVRCPLVLE